MSYNWDNNGNLLSDGERTFVYNTANQLVSVTANGETTTFTYDGAGNRVAKTAGGDTTRYALDVGGGLPEVIAETGGGEYLHAPNVLAMYDSGTWNYTLPDHLGSVRTEVDAAGQVTAARSFTPFGVPMPGYDGGTPYGYTGEPWEADAELLFLRARYYDPAVGRFLSRDSWAGDILRSQTLNGWDYVDNNPLRYTDPSGYVEEDEVQEAEYEIEVFEDWGYDGYEEEWFTNSCVPTWKEGYWKLRELEKMKEIVVRMGNVMGGKAEFTAKFGEVIVIRNDISTPANALLRDSTPITMNIELEKFDGWSFVHELGHIWDWNAEEGRKAHSRELEKITGGFTDLREAQKLVCDKLQMLPGCNEAGYFYGGTPPAGSDKNFDREEDFAESVAAYFFPDDAKVRAERKARLETDLTDSGDYTEYLYYDDYRDTPRWKYIDGLINK